MLGTMVCLIHCAEEKLGWCVCVCLQSFYAVLPRKITKSRALFANRIQWASSITFTAVMKAASRCHRETHPHCQGCHSNALNI